jgi:uncharacterized damage-inducible protein DinB
MSASQRSDGSTHDLPERTFGWWDMFTDPDSDPREAGEQPVGERAVLARFLRDQRLTLEMKCSGLNPEAMARRSVPPSDLSLLGLVRHMARVEQHWFREVLAAQDVPRLYRTEQDGSAEFTGATGDQAVTEEAWQTWRTEVAFAEQLVEEAPDLEMSGPYRWGDQEGTISLREVLVHMIEEYARHNGHADFLRERIDGRVGQ